ncbi:MAG: DUF971 domain-containing protein [Verrucomicrobiales bacterium]|nr:DUF971 domain-containing protein [Verrucomicrobiales bacterium]
MLTPENIQSIGDSIAVKWSDGSEDFYPMETLRAASPSAENRGETDLLGKVVYGGSGEKDFSGVTVTGWVLVGGYAVQFTFSDGHATGLYGFDYLKKLGEVLSGEGV